MCPNVSLNVQAVHEHLGGAHRLLGFLRIGGHRICLDTVVGFTDGTPPGAVDYDVRDPGQHFVGAGPMSAPRFRASAFVLPGIDADLGRRDCG